MKPNFWLLAPDPPYPKLAVFPLTIDGSTVPPSPQVKSLGVVLDSSLSVHSHINNISRSAYFHLRNINRLSPLTPLPFYFTASSPAVLIAVIHCCSASCNSRQKFPPRLQLFAFQFSKAWLHRTPSLPCCPTDHQMRSPPSSKHSRGSSQANHDSRKDPDSKPICLHLRTPCDSIVLF